MSIDIKSMLIGRTQGKKAGGGYDPVLTELTVTENGVYDEPTITGSQTVTWDCVVGDRVTGSYDGMRGMTFVKVSDRVLSNDELANSTITITGADGTFDEMKLNTMGDIFYEDGFATAALLVYVISKPKNGENVSGFTATFPETGIYIIDMNALGYPTPIVSLTLTFSASTPADGWNKVTVEVEAEPVLAELTVTENGVYDQPTVDGEVNIAVGETVTFKEHPTLDGLSDEVVEDISSPSLYFYTDDTISYMATNRGGMFLIQGTPKTDTSFVYTYLDEVTASNPSLVVVGADGAGWYKQSNTTYALTKLESPPSITIADTGCIPELTSVKTFFSAPAVPADGWNKVTVAVEAEPVLAELVVTENGVYDEPMIAGALDFSVGSTIKFKKDITEDDLPAEMLTISQPQQVILVMSEKTQCAVELTPSNDVLTMMITVMFLDDSGNIAGAVVFLNEAAVLSVGGQLGATEPGWYSANMSTGTYEPLDEPPAMTLENTDTLAVLTDFKNFFEAPSTPADGWNKVTVNVAGGGDNTVIDVTELPTENVDDSKIYRTTKATEMQVEDIYLYDWSCGKYITCAEYLIPEFGVYIVDTRYHTVKSLPETMLTSIAQRYEQVVFNVYVILETGETYVSMQDTGELLPFMESFMGCSQEYYKGTVNSVDDMVAPEGFYCLVSGGETRTIYGVSDIADNKTVFEYNGSEWVDCSPTILTELVVTENGVYDKPYVHNLPEIAVGNTVPFIKNITSDDIPKEFYPAEGSNFNALEFETSTISWSVGCQHVSEGIFGVYITGYPNNGEQSVYMYADSVMYSAFGGYIGIPAPGWYCDNGSALIPLDEPPSITIEDLSMVELINRYPSLFGIKSPADGWDKVTVNVVANVDVDVESILTESVKYNAAVNSVTDEALLNFLNYASLTGTCITGITDRSITSIKIPTGITEIGIDAFNEMTQLSSIEFPNGLTLIGGYSFSNCKGLTQLVLPETIEEIKECAFFDCRKLASVIFTGTPNIIDSYAFYQCDGMDIYVPWAEGAVAYAPWGAKNTTIHYNQTT